MDNPYPPKGSNLPKKAEPAPEQSASLAIITNNPDLIGFLNTLRDKPDKTAVKVNKFADDSLYLPIEHVESKLDYMFGGLWEVTDFRYSVIVNEITCSLNLRVFHPVAKTWITRAGCASVQIQLRAEYEMQEGKRVKKPVDVTDVSKKIANTLTKDLPHAKAEALKNAAKSLGILFGRDLNRGAEDSPQLIMTLEDAEIQITSIDNQAELNEFYNALPKVMKNDRRVKSALLKQQEFLKQNKDAKTPTH